MPESLEKRGPIEKTNKGWPINPFGLAALVVFAGVVTILVIKPVLSRNSQTDNQFQTFAKGGKITTPDAGQIIKGDSLTVELSTDDPQKVDKVQFWAKTYVDNKWQVIGEVSQAPYKLNWQIPPDFKNKAIALTTHIVEKDGNTIKDPGGWKEGIIILSSPNN